MVNHHLIFSVYNLRSAQSQAYPNYVLDHTHNGMIVEIGTRSEFGSFQAFKDHIASTRVETSVWLREYRQVRYSSGADQLYLVYSPGTQEFLTREINGHPAPTHIFECPDAVQTSGGQLRIGDVSAHSDSGVLTWLACAPDRKSITAAWPTDQAGEIALVTPWGEIRCESFAAGRISVVMATQLRVEIQAIGQRGPIRFHGWEQPGEVVVNGHAVDLKPFKKDQIWEV